MKIALITDRWQPRLGGAEYYQGRLSQYLASCGHELFLLCMDANVAAFPGKIIRFPGRELPRGMRELVFSRACEQRLSRLGCDLSLAFRHVERADVFLPVGGSIRANHAAQWESKSGFSNLFSRTFSWMDWKHNILARLEKALVRNTRWILVPSQRTAQEFIRLDPEAKTKVQVLWPGCDLSRFSPMGERDDFRARLGLGKTTKIALFVASDWSLKGLAPAMRVVQKLHERGLGTNLCVIGKNKNLSRWMRQARILGLEKHVHWLGEIQNMPPCYRGADFFLYPSYADSFGYVIAESLACGLPVITTRRAGAVDWFSHLWGQGLFLVDHPSDVEGMTQHALDLVRLNPKATWSLGLQFDEMKNLGELEKVLRSLISPL